MQVLFKPCKVYILKVIFTHECIICKCDHDIFQAKKAEITDVIVRDYGKRKCQKMKNGKMVGELLSRPHLLIACRLVVVGKSPFTYRIV